jgi:hypothetical protein
MVDGGIAVKARARSIGTAGIVIDDRLKKPAGRFVGRHGENHILYNDMSMRDRLDEFNEQK